MYAVIRIRGEIKTKPDVRKAFETLNLNRVNHMSIWPETKSNYRAIKKVEGYATFGNVNEEVLGMILEKRGNFEEGTDAKKAFAALKSGKSANEAGIKNCFRLSPPRKGHARKGIKKSFNLGGALGERREAINDLILKMI
jgi:large subunit ribosomal protein L30